MPAATLIRTARRGAGLTQAELASRAGMPQSSSARLEAPGSNPTVETLERVLHAVGMRLEATPHGAAGVDETLIAQNFELTPAERLEAFRAAYSNVRETLASARLTDA